MIRQTMAGKQYFGSVLVVAVLVEVDGLGSDFVGALIVGFIIQHS